jgi:hypothetical protein
MCITRRLARALASGALIVGLAACGDDDAGVAGESPPDTGAAEDPDPDEQNDEAAVDEEDASTAELDVCELISAEDVTSLVNTELEAIDTNIPGQRHSCEYESEGTPLGTVNIEHWPDFWRVQQLEPEEWFSAESRDRNDQEPVSVDIGDQAWLFTGEDTEVSTVVQVVDGPHRIHVAAVHTHGAEEAFAMSHDELDAAVIELARLAHERLGS